MGIFDKLFGKKPNNNIEPNLDEQKNSSLKKGDKLVYTSESEGYKLIRNLTNDQKELIEKSTLLLRTGQLYMHYWTDNLICTDRNDQEWQNKVMYFWKAEEPFPKKSLPSFFETFKEKYFLFDGDTSKISLKVGQAMPWFGMPGLGEKHVCEINGENATIPELNKLGLVEYIEPIELQNNTEILTDRENYLFLIDERITPFNNGNFYFKGQIIPINLAYSIGGIHIVKKVSLEA